MATTVSIPGYAFFTAPSDKGGTIRLLTRRIGGAVIVYKISKGAPGAIVDAFDPAALGAEARTPDSMRTPIRARALTALDAPPEAPKPKVPKKKVDRYSIVYVDPSDDDLSAIDAEMYDSQTDALFAAIGIADRAAGRDVYLVHGTQQPGKSAGCVDESGKRRPATPLYTAPEVEVEVDVAAAADAPVEPPVADDSGTADDLGTFDLLGDSAAA